MESGSAILAVRPARRAFGWTRNDLTICASLLAVTHTAGQSWSMANSIRLRESGRLDQTMGGDGIGFAR